jgi:hypothetical protein
MTLLQIPNSTLVRDTNSMALIVDDKNGLQEYYRKRNRLANQASEINTMKSDINNIKEDLGELKLLLMKLLEKSN